MAARTRTEQLATLVGVDRHRTARDVARRRGRRRWFALGAGFVYACGALGIVFAVPDKPLEALALGGCVLASLVWGIYEARKSRFRAIQPYVLFALDHDRCRSVFESVAASHANSSSEQVEAQRMLAALDLRTGDHDAALARLDRVLAKARFPARRPGNGATWLAVIDRFDLLAGYYPDRARARLPELDGVPADPVHRSAAQYAVLKFAISTKDLTLLPEDDAFHEWVKVALATPTNGMHLLTMIWVLRQRGDAEMADHVASNMRDRCSEFPADMFEAVDLLATKVGKTRSSSSSLITAPGPRCRRCPPST